MTLPLVVAATVGRERNRVAVRATPLACWRIEGMRFDFGSSVVTPDAEGDFTELAKLWHATGGPPVSVFAHADPSGSDDFNKTLSGRRAKAIYALLTRDVDKWDELYHSPWPDDDWNTRAKGIMRARLGPDAPSERRALFRAYMDAICHEPDGSPFVLQKTDFLGRGEDPGGKADFQGCSEFNPTVVFSTDESRGFQDPKRKDERDDANAPNRRVLVFLFPLGTRVPTASWPCPRASEPPAGCRAMFWPDGDARRAPQAQHREYDTARNTFACAFYDMMARRSPCETARKTLRIRLFDPLGKEAIPGAPYRMTVIATGDVRDNRAADAAGVLTETDVLAPSRILIEYGDPRLGQDPVPLGYQVMVFLDIDAADLDEPALRRRLHNLGYAPTEFFSDSLRAFQRDYGLPVTGERDPATEAAIIDAADHGKSRSDIAGGAATSGEENA
ncbi:MAG TPA: OmpA family protein [Kofleriaceae bacterium]